MNLLVTADWLNQHISDPNIQIIDVRWYLPEPSRGRIEYEAGHIPGALFFSIDSDLSAPRGQGPGRHPIPQPEVFAATTGRAGIGPETHVVAYDSSGGAAAARLWWLLRYFGHEHTSLLNGGWQAWQAAGLPIETNVPQITPTTFTARPHPELIVAAADVEALRHNSAALLLDARAAERYEGRIEPIDPRAGHIPGAISAPFADNIAADGRMRSAEELHTRFANLGANTTETLVCYCGSGVTAAHNLFALELAGITGGLLYEGSWSDWSSDPTRPAATGSEP